METSYLKTLELDKIIARAAEGCVCKEAREMLLATQPQCDPDEVRYALEKTDAINTLLIKNGSPRFGGVENVSQLAARAVKGGVLSMGELLMVAGALRNFQNLSSWYGASEHDALPTDDLFYALAPQPGLEQQISSAILAPDAMADTASYTLNDLRKRSAQRRTASVTVWRAWSAIWIPPSIYRKAWFPCAMAGMLCRSRANTAVR